jgi:hypothetical protein
MVTRHPYAKHKTKHTSERLRPKHPLGRCRSEMWATRSAFPSSSCPSDPWGCQWVECWYPVKWHPSTWRKTLAHKQECSRWEDQGSWRRRAASPWSRHIVWHPTLKQGWSVLTWIIIHNAMIACFLRLDWLWGEKFRYLKMLSFVQNRISAARSTSQTCNS